VAFAGAELAASADESALTGEAGAPARRSQPTSDRTMAVVAKDVVFMVRSAGSEV
jgi:hypothetical protein